MRPLLSLADQALNPNPNPKLSNDQYLAAPGERAYLGNVVRPLSVVHAARRTARSSGTPGRWPAAGPASLSGGRNRRDARGRRGGGLGAVVVRVGRAAVLGVVEAHVLVRLYVG